MIPFSIVGPDKVSCTPHEIKNFDDFVTMYSSLANSQPATTKKEDLIMFAPATYNDNYRNSGNFLFSNILVIDVDEGHTKKEILAFLDAYQYNYLLIESPSSMPHKYKCRIILELKRPVYDSELWRKGYEPTIKRHFPLLAFDPQCKDAARFFYIPNKTKVKTLQSRTDATGIDFQAPEKVAPSFLKFQEDKDVSIGKLWQRVEYLKMSKQSITEDYMDWVRVGHSIAALKNRGAKFEESLEIFDAFSQLDPDKYDKRAVAKKFENLWDSADATKNGPEKILKDTNDMGFKYPEKIEHSESRICIVEEGTSKRYYLGFKNTETLIKLTDTKDEFGVILQKVATDFDERFELTKKDLTFKDKDGKLVHLTENALKARFRRTSENKGFIIGAPQKGNYYNPETNSIEHAQHCRQSFTPTFHQDIDDFLKQLNVDYVWLRQYLYWFDDCSKTLPLLYLYGISNAAKTLFVNLLSTIFGCEANTDFFTTNDFINSPGKSPVIFMDEEMKETRDGVKTINRIKSFITSDFNYINMKHSSSTYVRRFWRFFVALNIDRPKFLLNAFQDMDAVKRRVQAIKFGLDQVTYINKVSTEVIQSWLSGRFGEHIAWIKQNTKPEMSNDIIMVPTYDTEDFNKDTANISEENEKIFENLSEVFEENKIGSKILAGSDEENFYLSCNQEYTIYLVEKRLLKKTMSTKMLGSIFKKVFPEMVNVKKRFNGKEKRVWQLPIDYALKQMEFQGYKITDFRKNNLTD